MATFTDLTFNTTAKPRTVKFQGREFFVAPAVMMTNGVHRGNKGKIKYGTKFLKQNVQAWHDFCPMTVYHPKRGDRHVSAKDIDVLNNQGIGFHRNTRFGKTSSGKYGWKTECWFDKELTKKVDTRVFDNLKSGRPTEVSTGMFLEVANKKGEYEGEKFDRVAVRMSQADHLAILPDQRGACSIKDGAGLLVNSSFKLRGFRTKDRRSEPTVNEMSFSDISEQIRQAIAAKNNVPGYSWNGHITDVFDGYCVYCVYGGSPDYKYTYYRQDYSVENDKVTLTGEPTEVQRKVNYVSNSEEGKMATPAVKRKVVRNKRRLVNLLVNSGGFDEKDRAWLKELSPSALSALREVPVKKLKVANKESDPDDDDDDGDEEPVVNAKKGGKKDEKKKPVKGGKKKVAVANSDEDDNEGTGGGTNLESLIANSDPKQVRKMFAKVFGINADLLREQRIAHQRERAKLIRSIVANEDADFTEEELAEKSSKELRKLAKLASVANRGSEDDDEEGVFDWPSYAGANGPDPTVNSEGDDDLPFLDTPDLFTNGEDRDADGDEPPARKKGKTKKKVRA